MSGSLRRHRLWPGSLHRRRTREVPNAEDPLGDPDPQRLCRLPAALQGRLTWPGSLGDGAHNIQDLLPLCAPKGLARGGPTQCTVLAARHSDDQQRHKLCPGPRRGKLAFCDASMRDRLSRQELAAKLLQFWPVDQNRSTRISLLNVRALAIARRYNAQLGLFPEPDRSAWTARGIKHLSRKCLGAAGMQAGGATRAASPPPPPPLQRWTFRWRRPLQKCETL